MYLVAALDQRPGPGAPQPSYRGMPPAVAEPVGIQHAVPRQVSSDGGWRALCGAGVSGWVVFWDRPFRARSGATCQRCAQLVGPAAPGGAQK
jgi:hypothetical protein